MVVVGDNISSTSSSKKRKINEGKYKYFSVPNAKEMTPALAVYLSQRVLASLRVYRDVN